VGVARGVVGDGIKAALGGLGVARGVVDRRQLHY